MNSMNNVNFLVGSSSYCLKPFEPFSSQVISFLNIFSKELNTEKIVRNYPDLKALSFWCRKKNILKMKQNFLSSSNRIGLGLVFHIAPSNIPTNFAYSLIFGLLSGNSNIVKVPSKNFDQIKIICNIFRKIFKKKKIFYRKKNNDNKI